MVELRAISLGEYEGNDFNDLISDAIGTVDEKRTSLGALASGLNMLSMGALKVQTRADFEFSGASIFHFPFRTHFSSLRFLTETRTGPIKA
jgi:hypothetical protein